MSDRKKRQADKLYEALHRARRTATNRLDERGVPEWHQLSDAEKDAQRESLSNYDDLEGLHPW